MKKDSGKSKRAATARRYGATACFASIFGTLVLVLAAITIIYIWVRFGPSLFESCPPVQSAPASLNGLHIQSPAKAVKPAKAEVMGHDSNLAMLIEGRGKAEDRCSWTAERPGGIAISVNEDIK